jgi:hypothetical protein
MRSRIGVDSCFMRVARLSELVCWPVSTVCFAFGSQWVECTPAPRLAVGSRSIQGYIGTVGQRKAEGSYRFIRVSSKGMIFAAAAKMHESSFPPRHSDVQLAQAMDQESCKQRVEHWASAVPSVLLASQRRCSAFIGSRSYAPTQCVNGQASMRVQDG